MSEIILEVNGTSRRLDIDPRTSLLDLLRERLGLTGSKKGCDHGQCGACTVLTFGRTRGGARPGHARDVREAQLAEQRRMVNLTHRLRSANEVIPLTVRAFAEDEPGDRMAAQLAAVWPAFRRWWQQGANNRPDTDQARARLEQHMPELVPTWQRLTAMLGDDPMAGAALALWNPPPFLTGCSQAAVLADGPALVRNYDWDYRLFDATVARTAYDERRVLGMLDCLWGLLDGVNDAVLARIS